MKHPHFNKLVQRVAKIDSEAAAWLRTNRCWLPDTHCDPVKLSQAFIWDRTPQGYSYWLMVADMLGEPYGITDWINLNGNA